MKQTFSFIHNIFPKIMFFFSVVLACQAWKKGFRKPCPAKIKIRFSERDTLGRFCIWVRSGLDTPVNDNFSPFERMRWFSIRSWNVNYTIIFSIWFWSLTLSQRSYNFSQDRILHMPQFQRIKFHAMYWFGLKLF